MFSIQNDLDLKIGVEVYYSVGIGLKCECYMIESKKKCTIPEPPKDREELLENPHKYRWDIYEIMIRVYGEKYSFKSELIFSEFLFIETPIIKIDIMREGKYPELIIKPSAPFQATLQQTLNIARSTQDKMVTPTVRTGKK